MRPIGVSAKWFSTNCHAPHSMRVTRHQYHKWDTDKTQTDKISNGHKIDMTNNKKMIDKPRKTSTGIFGEFLVSEELLSRALCGLALNTKSQKICRCFPFWKEINYIVTWCWIKYDKNYIDIFVHVFYFST